MGGAGHAAEFAGVSHGDGAPHAGSSMPELPVVHPGETLEGLAPMDEPMFGMFAPGRPVDSDFRQAEENKLLAQVVAPREVGELALFLLPGVSLPEGTGVAAFFAAPPFTNWQLLGTLRAGVPSAVWRTGWAGSDELASAPVVQIGLSLETDAYIDNLEGAPGSERDVAEKADLALGVGKHLYNFLASFSTGDRHPETGEEVIVLPQNALDRWLDRFTRKYRKDYTFLKKSAE